MAARRQGRKERVSRLPVPYPPPMPPATAARLAYRAELDGLRGVAILLVIGHHLILDGHRLLAGGFVGVNLFFVISGALITTLLLREHRETGGINLAAFYLRRATRLLPALVVMLAFCVAFTALFWSPDHARNLRADALYALFFLSSWVTTSRPMWLLSTTWSLSIEEWYYLVWPVTLLALLRARARTGLRPAVLALALVVLACFTRRVHLCEVEIASFRRIYFGLDTRADALACGGLVAVAAEVGWPESEALVTWGAAAGTLFFAAAALFADHETRAFSVFGYSSTAIAAGFIVLHALRRPSRVLCVRPLVATGRISYSLYLWLLPVFTILQRSPTGLRLAGLLAVSVASYRWVERPGLRARLRLSRLRGRGIESSSALGAPRPRRQQPLHPREDLHHRLLVGQEREPHAARYTAR